MTLKHTTALLGALALLAGAASAGGNLVIEAGRIITQSGGDITEGVIVIQDGRITAVGAADEVERPWDANVIGGPDLVAFPGFVETLSNRGMDRSNESVDVAPYLDIRDSVDPVSFYFEDCLRYGITTIGLQQGDNCVVGGRGMIVKPGPMTVEQMMLRSEFGVALSAAPKRGNSRATQAQALRRVFTDLERDLQALVEDRRDEAAHGEREALYQGRELDEEDAKGRAMTGTAWTVEGLEAIPRRDIDAKIRPLIRLVEGRINAFFYCGAPTDVRLALEVARDNGFLHKTTLVLDDSCWKAADIIAEAGVSVVLDENLVHVERDPLTGDEIETYVPGVFDERGVSYALASADSTGRSLWYQAALATGRGTNRQKALDAVTVVPAEILGLGDRIGRLEPGFDGNVLLLTGDPLSVTTWVEQVVIEGDVVYERSKDIRNKHLYEGESPAMAAAPTEDGE